MGSGASSPDPCLAGFFALRCFSLITIWVTPESWAVKLITPLPHWFYTRILRVPKCFSPQAFRLTPKSAHNLGISARNFSHHGDLHRGKVTRIRKSPLPLCLNVVANATKEIEFPTCTDFRGEKTIIPRKTEGLGSAELLSSHTRAHRYRGIAVEFCFTQ